MNPNNFGPNIKCIKYLESGCKTRVGRVSGKNTLGLIGCRNSDFRNIGCLPSILYIALT